VLIKQMAATARPKLITAAALIETPIALLTSKSTNIQNSVENPTAINSPANLQ